MVVINAIQVYLSAIYFPCKCILLWNFSFNVFSPFIGQKPKVSENDFEDLLSNQGFSAKSDKKGPKTIAEMRKQEMSKDMDPLKLKVCLTVILSENLILCLELLITEQKDTMTNRETNGHGLEKMDLDGNTKVCIKNEACENSCLQGDHVLSLSG